ncbi:Glucose dehydrogenase choline dehydrogenase mandelonitrile lyase (GMC oxidoreductase family) [Olea europaea subsp. europaea]|uniref:Glucose dehydrogenase choline dehydrogenase mandelonitrile lyase (GMC oxidoreductase family) n=1 Tax=Olea europaea subsp. europaea TaxID=158383 RepID=A0A8S0UUM9_OLEEU|nr:Glucose dehydrogenase choline dehydrogenase mandelonitrile lyase (GMC oxidoreductase family) [Olea europaea subsp. europaea]
MSDNPMNLIYVPTSLPVEQSLVQTVGITKMGVYIEASSGFGQSSGSIHWDHGLVTAEMKQAKNVRLFGWGGKGALGPTS